MPENTLLKVYHEEHHHRYADSHDDRHPVQIELWAVEEPLYMIDEYDSDRIFA